MRYLRVKVLVVLSIISLEVAAQQSVQWSQYMLHPYTFNPAYAGLDRSLSVTAGMRSQWSQFGDAPITQMVQAHLPMYVIDGAVGLTMTNDQLGIFKRTSVTASYNYVLDSPIGLLSAGFRFGGQQVTLDSDRIRTPDGVYVDNAFNHNDLALNDQILNGFAPIWGAGLFLSQEYLDLGLSIDNFSSTEAGPSKFNEHLLFTAYGSYQFYLTDIIAIEPSVLVKTDRIQTQTDIAVLGHYEQFFGGFSIRGYNSNSFDAVGVLAGIRVSNHVRVSYSFDLGLSDLRRFHDGTHEFIFNYNLNKPIRTGELPPIIYNPRFN